VFNLNTVFKFRLSNAELISWSFNTMAMYAMLATGFLNFNNSCYNKSNYLQSNLRNLIYNLLKNYCYELKFYFIDFFIRLNF